MIRQHPQIGAEILEHQPGLNSITVDMTLNHHERLDGKGYPNGISGDAINLPPRICAVVDVCDEMSSARPYRGPIPPRAVLDMMRAHAGMDRILARFFDARARVRPMREGCSGYTIQMAARGLMEGLGCGADGGQPRVDPKATRVLRRA